MTNAKVCGNCWHSSPSGICRKHGAPITPNSTCDSYEKDPYVYDVFIDSEFLGKGRIASVLPEGFRPGTEFTMELTWDGPVLAPHKSKPTDGSGSDPKPAQCPGQSCDHPGCPRANNGEFDHSGYYRYIPQQSGADRTDDEGDSDVQLEEVVDDLSDRVDLIDSDTNSRIDTYRDKIYKLEDRADVNDSWAESLLPVLVIAYIGTELAIAAGAGVFALVIAVGLFIYYIAFNALRKDARDK